MIRDRIQQTTTTSGTGTLSLDGPAPAGYVAFASKFNNGDKVYYCVVDGASWEIIEGVFASGGPPTLTRVRTLDSSNGGSPVSFSSAAKQIFSDAPAEFLGAMGGRLKAANSTNVGNAFSVTLPVPVAGPTLADHMEFWVRMNAAPTGAATLAVNGGTAKNIRKLGGKAVIDGDWGANYLANYRYDLTNDCFIWLNASEISGVKTISATTYTILAEDHGQLLRFTSATGCAVAVPQALATNAFARPFYFDYLAQGGAVTFTPATSTIDGAASLVAGKGTSGQCRSDHTNYWVRKDAPVSAKVPARQCVLSSAVDSAGLPNYISIGSGLAVNIDASPTPVILTAANGFDANGAIDLVGVQSADTSISGLTANTTNYLYADIASDGSVTFGKTAVAPDDQEGGTYSVTNGKFTFNIAEMVGKVGNGSAATQTYRVFIGEAVTNASNVTSVVHYALQGRYFSVFTATLPGTGVNTSFNHNLGVKNIKGIPTLVLECTTADGNHAVGDRIYLTGTNNGSIYPPIGPIYTAKAVSFTPGSSQAFVTQNKSTGAVLVLTAASWKYAINVSRGW